MKIWQIFWANLKGPESVDSEPFGGSAVYTATTAVVSEPMDSLADLRRASSSLTVAMHSGQ